jgi:hypothetical protein
LGWYDWFEKTTKLHRFNIEYLVDSSENQQGKAVHHGHDVFDPSVLRGLKDKNRYYIIITTTAFYEAIDKLVSYGFKPGVHFCVTPLLQNFKIIDDILSHKQKIILSSSDAVKNSKVEGGGLYIYDTQTRMVDKKVSGITRGFCRHKDNYFVVDALKGVRVLDRMFNDIDGFSLPGQSVPHGIVVDSKKKLIFVVLSRLDKVGVFDLRTYNMVHTISLSDKYEKTGIYHHHMNDICLDGDYLYISMFSKSGNVQKNVFDGAIVEYDTHKDRVSAVLVDRLWQPHTIRIINRNLCYLDSMRGSFHTATYKPETHFHGFVRGLDFDGKYYYIGQSLHRYFDRMKGYSDNISMDCGFFMYDSDSKATKFFPVENLKDINTLKLLNPFPGVV